MKDYSLYHKASIMISDDQVLKSALKVISDDIQIIIETGTYNGLGSTKTLSQIFNNKRTFERLYTCEVNWLSFVQAKRNLKQYHKTTCIYGSTVDYEKAYNFIENDPYLINHEKFNDIYIDDVMNPVNFYLNELNGNLGGKIKLNIFNKIKKAFYPSETELLKKLIIENFNKKLLVVLDSAGGIGYLEFQLVSELLINKEYYLLLDDIHHIKHYRSYQALKKNNTNVKTIAESFEDGWILAKVGF